ncbi:MAG: helix-hairpin-helix domain-containing protein [Candidatus Heimdallarchaeota archaeon]|nr:helix-hairpin-helix domain-containing protein [Candidatus Heimdallarchaeota archaeon]
MELLEKLSQELSLDQKQLEKTIRLFDEGNTLHYIARYRKDMTGGLEAEQLAIIQKRVIAVRNLIEAKSRAIEKLQESGELSDELILAINQADIVKEVDEIMQPYKSKRKTRASIAREMGLQPVADIILGRKKGDLENTINNISGNRKEIIAASLDIVAEEAINFPKCHHIAKEVVLNSVMTISYNQEKDENGVYESLTRITGQLNRIKPHQIQALLRAEKEKIISLKLSPDLGIIQQQILSQKFYSPPKQYHQLYQRGVEDGIKRLLQSRAKNAAIADLKQKADERAITVFKNNLQQLLLQPPINPTVVLAIDPGFRSGCKVAIVDKRGNLLKTTTIYPTPPKEDTEQAKEIILGLIKNYQVGYLVLGNGTASQETRKFLQKEVLSKHNLPLDIISEDGASVYSASKLAQEEFPDLESGVRGAISLARRVLDPLGELIKVDPSSLGIGQYQHDVDEKALKEALEFVVDSCINQVGIDLLQSSKEGLKHISGLNDRVAQRIVEYRNINRFNSLDDLRKVKGLGEKTFTQAVGFLRLKDSSNPLDATMIHPEHYQIANQIIQDSKINNIEKVSKEDREIKLTAISTSKYITDEVGPKIVEDIISELIDYGLDPRGSSKIMKFDEKISTIADLEIGDIKTGIVRNVLDFGAFIDLGIKENGLIHISKLSDQYITNIHQFINVGERVKVEVIQLDLEKKRIGLKLVGKL